LVGGANGPISPAIFSPRHSGPLMIVQPCGWPCGEHAMAQSSEGKKKKKKKKKKEEGRKGRETLYRAGNHGVATGPKIARLDYRKKKREGGKRGRGEEEAIETGGVLYQVFF